MNNIDWWYSWFGANKDIFFLIYGQGISSLQFLFPALEALGSYRNITLYAALAIFLTAGQYIYRKLNGYRYDAYYIRSQTAWLLSFVTSFLTMVAIISIIKDFAAFPRPYVVLGDQVRLLYGIMEKGKYNQSFPSGHAAFTAFVVAIFWSRSIGMIKSLLAVLLILMCWYRVSIGAHFPADVVYGTIIGLLSVGINRKFWCKLYKVWK